MILVEQAADYRYFYAALGIEFAHAKIASHTYIENSFMFPMDTKSCHDQGLATKWKSQTKIFDPLV